MDNYFKYMDNLSNIASGAPEGAVFMKIWSRANAVETVQSTS